MNQRMLRTLTFVGAAAVCLGGAVATSIYNRPAKLDDTALVGQEFFPDFLDPTKATALRVAAYDKDAAKVNVFNVEFNNGLWRIPSHHNYPADGEEQLAKTAASVIGIKRGLYAGKTPEDQKRMGVLDPLDDKITGTEGRGSRITLFQAGKPLVDFIIGNKVDEAGNIYYVRTPDDNRVYRAELAGLKVSTKFADWIEPDLLKIDRNKLVQMVIDRYQVDEQRGSLKQGEISVLTKKPGDTAAQWELEGLDAATEKVKVATVNQMSFALDDLKIVGVREKPAGLVDVLQGKAGAALNQIEIIQMQRAGYFLTPEGQLVSNEGEILAGTDEGVRYTLRFGEVLSGTDMEIEVGSDAETSADPAKAEGDAADTPDESADNPDVAEKTTDDASVQKNRYVFITAAFDESLLGERPTAPVKPEPPAGATAPAAEQPSDQPATDSGAATTDETEKDPLDAAAEEAEAEEAAADATTANTDQPVGDAAAEPAATDTAAEPAAADAAAEPGAQPAATGDAGQAPVDGGDLPVVQPDPQKEYEAALKKYEGDLAAYEAKITELDKKIEDGQKLAKDLNDRFAPWYYVISADLFAKLKVARSELVEPATPAATPSAGAATPPTGLPFNIPTSPEDAAAKQEAATEPAAEPAATPEAGTPADPPAEEAKPAEPATSDAPAEGGTTPPADAAPKQ